MCVEKKQDSIAERYDIIIIALLIIIGLMGLIYVALNDHSMTITELLQKDTGVYFTSGFVSNINTQESKTTFTLADSNDFIESIIFSKSSLISGESISGYCSISVYNNKKECIFKEIKKN